MISITVFISPAASNRERGKSLKSNKYSQNGQPDPGVLQRLTIEQQNVLARLIGQENASVSEREEATRQLCECNLDGIYSRFYYWVGNKQDAEDRTQETFIRAIKGLRQRTWTGEGSFPAWLYGIARFVQFDEARKAARRSTTFDFSLVDRPGEGTDGLLDVILAHERGTALWSLVKKLPPLYQHVLVSRYKQSLPYAAIALEVKQTPDYCRMIHLRAMKALRDLIHKEDLWDVLGITKKMVEKT